MSGPGDEDEVPVQDERSGDDRDEGWGGSDGSSGERDDDWYRAERPPHWD